MYLEYIRAGLMTGSDLSFIKGMHTDYIKWWGKAEKKKNAAQIRTQPWHNKLLSFKGQTVLR